MPRPDILSRCFRCHEPIAFEPTPTRRFVDYCSACSLVIGARISPETVAHLNRNYTFVRAEQARAAEQHGLPQPSILREGSGSGPTVFFNGMAFSKRRPR